jgi:hypothetical protein
LRARIGFGRIRVLQTFKESSRGDCCTVIIPAVRLTRLEPRQKGAKRRPIMKYVISWRERPAASAKDYEAAHERVLEIFKDWKMPASFSVLQFVVRIGDYGGYMIVETDKPTDIHYVTSFFAVFEFKVEPVVDVMDAVAVEVKAIEYRKKNFS